MYTCDVHLPRKSRFRCAAAAAMETKERTRARQNYCRPRVKLIIPSKRDRLSNIYNPFAERVPFDHALL